MLEIFNESKVENEEMAFELTPDMKTYEELLLDASSRNSVNIFPNADKDHAAIAFSVLFSCSISSVNLVVQSFVGDVSNNPKYVKSLSDCLERGIAFNVLSIEEPSLPHSKGYKKLLEKSKVDNSKVVIKKASAASIEILKRASNEGNLAFKEIHNFALFDNEKYRLEFLPSKYMALISFNDRPFVAKYKSTFNEAFKVAIPSA